MRFVLIGLLIGVVLTLLYVAVRRLRERENGVRCMGDCPDCIYCDKYAMWDGDNVCFDKGEPKIIDPRRRYGCRSFYPRRCQTDKALKAVIDRNERMFKRWCGEGDDITVVESVDTSDSKSDAF